MAVNIGINGFGRIGRLVFRQLLSDKNFEIVAINDIAKPDMLAYLLKYDTTQGKASFADSIAAGPDFISVKGKKIKILAESDPEKLPWKRLRVDLVLECTGRFATREKAAAHISAGAKRVVISAPAGEDIPTIVFGVNEKSIGPQDRIISTASCTTNCLAPMAKTLHKLAPIQSGIMVTVHAYTGEQSILDSPQHKGIFRRSRAGAANITPVATGAAQAIGLVIPELKGKLTGAAQRVPVATGSTAILSAVVQAKNLDVETVNRAMKAASNRSFGYNKEEIVSSDVIGSNFGALFDATQTLVLPLREGPLREGPIGEIPPEDPRLWQVQVVSWYDNESSYASQMVRTIKYFASLGPARKQPSPAKPGSAKKPVADKNRERQDKPPLPRKPLINFPK
jgi:glyceraldehyde 3-phosphate dehydrogenase